MPDSLYFGTDIQQFVTRCGHRGALVALDISRNTIGLAACDPDRILVTPLHSLARRNWKMDVLAIQQACNTRKVTGIIVGYPLNMDGTSGPAAQSRRASARSLSEYLQMPVLLFDERLSTQEASQISPEKKRHKTLGPDDHWAAFVILQDFLRQLDAVNPNLDP